MRFGKITLKFGNSGDSSEEPLSFETAAINLIVGPNDAGKSLFLRELSGLNPRRRRTRFTLTHGADYSDRRLIVSSAMWSVEELEFLRTEAIRKILDEDRSGVQWPVDPPKWLPFREALEHGAGSLDTLRHSLVQKILNLHPDLLKKASDLGITRDMIAGAEPLVLGMFALTVISSALEEEVAAEEGQQVQGYDALALLEGYWTEAREILLRLGVEAPSFSIADILDRRRFFGALLKAVAGSPLAMFAQKLPEFKEGEPFADEASARELEQFKALVELFVNPGALLQLRTQIEAEYKRGLWDSGSARSKASKGYLYLDGVARLSMTRSTELQPFSSVERVDSPIGVLHRRPERLRELRRLVYDALGKYIVVDMTTDAPNLVWRLSEEEPAEGIESNFSATADEFNRGTQELSERSDGIHAYVGMLAAIVAKGGDVVFVDEPEAFLHPPLTRKLARQLDNLAREHHLQFFIATHSADLVESFVTSGIDINVVRLTYNGEFGTSRIINSADAGKFALDPLLRSERTLSALFHRGAIVCEAASDRVLYQEVNERLLAEKESQGASDCVFLNAQNWQTIGRMIGPLRRMGVPAAAIIDADALMGDHLHPILEAAQVPPAIIKPILQMRADLKKTLFCGNGASRLDHEVIFGMTKGDNSTFVHLCERLLEYGVFVVSVGELEDWFKYLGLEASRKKKRRWLEVCLGALGWDPKSESYECPRDDDIWKFVRGVAHWIHNPKRKGCADAG